ncbi:hypothetical protein [Mycobacterium sp.]|uniref:hypothetical protein n=1 Tax=Mycobacterium sp. TaxID=1785 RepID=UPI003C762896
MAGIDLGARFERIPQRAKAASDEVRAAGQRTEDELRTAAGSARNRATAAADGLKDNAAAAASKVSQHWQEVRAKWQAHVAAVQSDLDQAGDAIEASSAIVDADVAESYAEDTIDFAAAAIEEAESAVINSMYFRSRAALLNS